MREQQCWLIREAMKNITLLYENIYNIQEIIQSLPHHKAWGIFCMTAQCSKGYVLEDEVVTLVANQIRNKLMKLRHGLE